MNLNEVSAKAIGAAIDVHKEIGPGLLESVYQKCLEIELKERGLQVCTEMPICVNYKGHEISDNSFRIDLIVEKTTSSAPSAARTSPVKDGMSGRETMVCDPTTQRPYDPMTQRPDDPTDSLNSTN